MLRKEDVEGGLVADLQRELMIAAIIGRRIGRGRNGWGRRRRRRNIIPAKRTVDKRLLPVIGRLQHIVAHEAERSAHRQARESSGRLQRTRQLLPKWSP